MFIVYQNETEVTKLNHAYITDCDIMHFDLDQRTSEGVASYPTPKEAQEHFNDMLYYLRRDETVYEFPKPRTSPSEPSKP